MTWPLFRYGTDEVIFTAKRALPFPENAGESYFTYATQNPEFMTTERFYPTTNFSGRVGPMKIAQRDDIAAFWTLVTSYGEYDFTFMDHRQRFLFDCHWAWEEEWSRLHGGVHYIPINIESPFPWTAPMRALYSMVDESNKLRSHTLITADDLAAGVGLLVKKSSWAGLNKVGTGNTTYGMVYSSSGAGVAASSESLAWAIRQSGDFSFTLFTQFIIPQLGSAKACNVMRVQDAAGDNYAQIVATYSDASQYTLTGAFCGATTAKSTAGALLNEDTWYDAALAYDHVNGKAYLYFAPSGLASAAWATTDDFLNGKTAMTDGVLEAETITKWSEAATLTKLYILQCAEASTFATTYAGVQFPMCIDAFISPLEFNFMRRLCHQWNRKATGAWPK